MSEIVLPTKTDSSGNLTHGDGFRVSLRVGNRVVGGRLSNRWSSGAGREKLGWWYEV